MPNSSFDRNTALEHLGGDEALLAEVVSIFLHDAPSHVAALRDSLAHGDGLALSRQAHTLKGSAGYLGATELCAAAQVLETLGKSGTLAGADDALLNLERAAEGLLSSLASLPSQP